MPAYSATSVVKAILTLAVVAFSAYQISAPAHLHISTPEPITSVNQKLKPVGASHLEGSLFGISHKNQRQAPQKIQLRITGLLPNSSPKMGSAFLQVQGMQEELYSIGDLIIESAFLVEVRANEIVIENSGFKQTYSLEATKSLVASQQNSFGNNNSDSLPKNIIATKSTSPSANTTNNKTIEVSRLNLVRQFAPKLSSFLKSSPKEVMSELNVSTRNGSYVIGANSPLNTLGLREHDQVLSINGSDINSFLASRPSIKDVMSRPMQLSIVRNNQRQNLTLKLN